MVGIIQEQHAERCRLFMQWQKMDFPILVDSLNLLGLPVIPVVMGIDEHGVLRQKRLRRDTFATFAEQKHPAPKTSTAPLDLRDIKALEKAARKAKTAVAWRTLGDGAFLFGDAKGLDLAIEAYQRAMKMDPKDGKAAFRLGVSYRRRFDEGIDSGDFARAANAWSAALDVDPGQYIWRRRIQQYGPRLDKPYNFYRWIDTAQKEVIGRGEAPVAQRIPLTISEQAAGGRVEAGVAKNPDPKGKIPIDEKGLVRVAVAAVPATVEAGKAVRVHVVLDPADTAKWDPAAGPAKVWLETPVTWLPEKASAASDDSKLTKAGRRRIEAEFEIPSAATAGDFTVKGFVIYPVCESEEGQCLFLRRNIEIKVKVAKKRQSRRR